MDGLFFEYLSVLFLFFSLSYLEHGLGALPRHVRDVPVVVLQPQRVLLLHVVRRDETHLAVLVLNLVEEEEENIMKTAED